MSYYNNSSQDKVSINEIKKKICELSLSLQLYNIETCMLIRLYNRTEYGKWNNSRLVIRPGIESYVSLFIMNFQCISNIIESFLLTLLSITKISNRYWYPCNQKSVWSYNRRKEHFAWVVVWPNKSQVSDWRYLIIFLLPDQSFRKCFRSFH